MINPLNLLVGPVLNFFTQRGERKQAIKEKRIDQVVNAQDATAAWEAIQAENGRTSWKDEFWTVVLAIPAIGAFIPGGSEWVTEGFAALAGMPDFYQYWLGIAILTSFGVRFASKKG
jgi:hypothetical protein